MGELINKLYCIVPVLRDEHGCPSLIEGGRLNKQPDNDEFLKIIALIFPKIFLIECCTVLVERSLTSSRPSFA